MKNLVNKNVKRPVNTPKVVREYFSMIGKQSHKAQKLKDPVAYQQQQAFKSKLGTAARWGKKRAK